MLVSVITVSYNAGRFLEDNILSVKGQDYSNIEHIVIDGGSTDSTVDILKRYKDVKWVSEPDKGVTDAFNKGICMASGEILCFQNSDDVFYSQDAVTKAVGFMKENPDAGVIFGDYATMDEDCRIKYLSKGEGKQVRFFDLMCSETAIPLPSAFVRRFALDAVGSVLDDRLDFAPDWELWIRIGVKFPLIYVPGRFGSARKYDGEVRSTLRCAFENPAKRRLVLDRIFEDPGLSSEIKALKRHAYAGTYRNEALRLFSIGHRKKAVKSMLNAIRLYPLYILDSSTRSIFLGPIGVFKLMDILKKIKKCLSKKRTRPMKVECVNWWKKIK